MKYRALPGRSVSSITPTMSKVQTWLPALLMVLEMRNPVTHLPTEPLGAEHGDQRAAAGPQQSIDLFLGGVQFGPHRPEAPVGHDDAEGGLGVPVIANQNLAGCHHRDAGNGGDAI